VLIEDLSAGPELRAAGVTPPSRQLMIMLLGGLRELIATTGEDGGDIGGITEVAVQATQALLGPSGLAPSRPAPSGLGPSRKPPAPGSSSPQKLPAGNLNVNHVAGRNRRPGGEWRC
jgi:hypothetical protein